MNPEFAAQTALGTYTMLAVLVIVWQVVGSRLGWQAWLLYVVQRTYGGLCFHWRSNRRCPFPDEGPALIIANHRSPVDPMMVWTNHHLNTGQGRIRVIGFLMAKEYYEIKGLQWLCRNVRSIPLERGAQDTRPVREALRRLKAGELLGVFPEGRINSGNGLLTGNPGIAWLALTAKVPVYPVFIHNAPQGKSMLEPFYRCGRVKVCYGDPIDLTEYYGRRKSQELLKQVTDLLMQRLASLGGVVYEGSSTNGTVETFPIDRATG